MLVKNVRKMTVLPNQRMHASSKKRMKKLIRKSSMPAWRPKPRGTFAVVISDLGEAFPTVGVSLGAKWASLRLIDQGHGRDHGRLDLANQTGGLFDLFASDAQVSTCPNDLASGYADQDTARAQVGGHIGRGADRGFTATHTRLVSTGPTRARSHRSPRTRRPESGRWHGPHSSVRRGYRAHKGPRRR